MKTGSHRGALSKPVTVTTNDPAQASVVLNIQAQVQGSVLVLPTAALSFATFSERPGRLLIRKDPTETGTLAVGGVAATLDWLQVTARKVADGETAIEGVPQAQAGDWLIEVRPASMPTPGAYNGTLTFDTGLPREPKVSVPLMTFVRPPITASPGEAVLRGNVETIVLVAARPDVDADALRATAEPAGLEAVLERSAQRTFRLHVAWKGDPATRPSAGKVKLGSGAASIEIPVRFENAPPAAPPTTN
jgi:hypothetical protein